MPRKILLTALTAVLLISDLCFAVGALYARRARSTDDSFPLWLKTYDSDVTITDQMAVTHIDHVFKNETSMQLEGLFIFPLPKNAIVTELALWINGVRVVGEVYESDTARAIYESIVRRRIDPALLEYLGDNVFKLSVFPIEPNGNAMSERRIEITYAELLPYEGGNIEYNFFMNTIDMSSKALERASVDIDLSTQKKIIALSSTTHSASDGLVIQKESDYSYSITYGEENTESEKDLRIYYELENTDYALTHLTYVPDPVSGMFFDSQGDDSYYLLWVTPPDNVTQEQIIKKNIVFVADISSSMSGTRMTQLRKSLNSMVGMLNQNDMFNIIAFNTGIYKFKPDLVEADESSIAEALQFVNELGEVGLTNIEDALRQALKSSWEDTTMNAIVFLTDGTPTWPTTSTAATILDMVETENTNDVIIFSFGIGDDIEEPLIAQLAKNNSGLFQLITDDDSIGMIMENFMEKVSHPLIKNIAMNYGDLDRYDFYPRSAPNLYAGTQFAQLGRYRNTGSFHITFSGDVGSKSLFMDQTLPFPSETHNHPFVARMWASSKIDYLLDEISIYGEQDELLNAVKVVGKKYGIITPYTSMLVLEPTDVIEDKISPLQNAIKLFKNYPNPFNASTTLRYSIPRLANAEKISLKIYDARGKMIRILVDELTMGGNYVVEWDALDYNGSKVSSGFYVAVLEVGKIRQMIRMRLIR